MLTGRIHWFGVIAVLPLTMTFVAVNQTLAANIENGLLVEEVQPYFAGGRAGIQSGDILIGWSSADGGVGVLSTDFDLVELEHERHPQESVTLHGLRRDKKVSFDLGPGKWRVVTRPRWDDELNARYSEIRSRLEHVDDQSDIDNAIRFSVDVNELTGNLYAAWFLSRAADLVSKQGQWQYASQLYEVGIEVLDRSINAREVAYLQHELGYALMVQSKYDKSLAAYHASLETNNAISPERLGIAENIKRQGSIAIYKGELDSAIQYLEDALWRQERVAPDSLLVANTLGELVRAANTKGDFIQGERYGRRALAIAEALVPGGTEVAKYSTHTGISLRLQGDEAGAEALYEQALEIAEAQAANSRSVATILNNLGTIREDRGDFAAATDYFRRALALQQRLAPDSASVAILLNNLGLVSMLQGGLEGAKDYHLRAYALERVRNPDSLALATSLSHLGKVARFQQDYDAAVTYLQGAIEIMQRLAPMNVDNSRLWLNLGAIERSRGNLQLAKEHVQRALSISRTIAPNGRGVAEAVTEFGSIALAENRIGDAEKRYYRALSIFNNIAPDTYHQAEVLYGLARVHRDTGKQDAARSYFERAIDALDAQHARLGGTDETKARSRARFLQTYKDYIAFLLQIGDEARAFEVLERSRSKVLSDLLNERDLVFAQDIPVDLDRERRILSRSYKRLQETLFETHESERITELQRSIREVRAKQERIQRQIAEQSPRLTSLQTAASVSLAGARKVIPPGAAVLSYSVGDETTHLFVLTADGELSVHRLATGRATLDADVTRLRHLIDAGRWDRIPDSPLVDVATELYRTLLLPVESLLDDSDRLLVIPDGPLNVLPFAALMQPADNGRQRYLAELKPSHVVNSLTIFAQLQSQRERATPGTLVAFGDPDYTEANNVDVPINPTADRLRHGQELKSLPWSGDEVEDIKDIYQNRATVYTGADATESRAMQVAVNTQYLHFAVHALLDEKRPMETSIVLTTSKTTNDTDENGYLQAWEVYEGLRLTADLVTLSACETALGTDYPGEGLIGLTRAFHYAGASSVLASLWQVKDRSTSRLMKQFYANLRAGMPQPEALQKAQLAMIRNDKAQVGTWSVIESIRAWFGKEDNDYSHPYHWAGFVLNGAGQ